MSRALLGAVLWLAAAQALAQAPAVPPPTGSGVSWQSLSPQPARARGSKRGPDLARAPRATARQRFGVWRAMPAEQRQLLRQRWQTFKSLPPDQQQRVRDSFRRFRQMSPERRQELRRQWRQMSPEQRHQMMHRSRAAPHAPR